MDVTRAVGAPGVKSLGRKEMSYPDTDTGCGLRVTQK
jgi:hypothetical protein